MLQNQNPELRHIWVINALFLTYESFLEVGRMIVKKGDGDST